MDKIEAREILRRELARWLELPWSALRDRVGSIEVLEVVGRGGAKYQIEIEAVWDEVGGAIHVMGGIDDGGLSAFAPLTLSVPRRPQG